MSLLHATFAGEANREYGRYQGTYPGTETDREQPVSYTHLDVYKRQGHRYSCLCVLASYAVKCDIPEDELFTDAFSLLQFLDDMSDDEHNRFTKRDIMDAMQFYQENYVTYSRSEAERVSAIPMPANKRNYQKQADHLEEARAIRDIRMKRQDRDWREGNGRPKGSGEKSKIVEEWQRQHPDGKKADCIRETGLSKPTVYKWWK